MRGRRLRKLGGALAAGAVAASLPLVLSAVPASAADTDIRVTEVNPRGSDTPLGEDWFELTNVGSSAVDITGWRIDDSSNSFASAGAINGGVTTIAPGESVILVMEGDSADPDAFRAQYWGPTPPLGLQVGWVSGSGLGLSSGGDAINVFNAGGTRVADVTFGSTADSFQSLDNSGGGSGAITLRSTVGVNGAFLAANGSEIGSPGLANGAGGGPTTTSTTTTTTAPPAADGVRVTEVSARGNSTPLGDDWIELTNFGAGAVDVTGWKVNDNSGGLGSARLIQGITSIGAGESVIVVMESPAAGITAFANQWFGGTLPIGLQVGYADGSGLGLSNDGDSVNVWDAANALVATVDYLSAPSGAPIPTLDNTVGANATVIATPSVLCVNEAFAASNGAELGSPGLAVLDSTPCPGPTYDPWPGSPDTQPAEDFAFGEDMSGLDHEPSGTDVPGVLWASRNKAGTLFRLVWDGAKWVPDSADGWAAGKDLRFVGNVGHPDSEGVTVVADSSAGGVYIASERDNDDAGVSRNTILRYDVTGSSTELVAVQQWDVNSALPVVGANLGLEGITWVDDAYLVANGFVEESTGLVYDPASYPLHGGGVFFVAVEGTARIYGFVLNSDGSFVRIAEFGADLNLVTDLQYDGEEQKLWAECDDSCNGRLSVLQIDPTTGKFVVVSRYERPAGLGNFNNEGFAIAPLALCVDGQRPVWWSDDSENGGVSIIQGALACGDGPTPVVPEFPVVALAALTGGLLFGGAVLVRRRTTAVRPAT